MRFHGNARFPMALAIAAALAALSCGLDEHYTGMGAGALPGDKLYPEPDAGGSGPCVLPDVQTGDVSLPPIDVADLGGKAYRFDTLVLGKPIPSSMSGLVNDTIVDQIAQQLINVLVVIDTDDRGAGTLAARLGTGPKPADGTTYAFGDAPQSIELAFDNPTFESTADATLSISVALGTDPLVLPIQALRLSGTVASDGSSLQSGKLTGAVTEEDAANVMIPVFGSLKDFLLTAQDPPIEPDTTVGGKPAWSFEATYTAASATVE
jgi:hypothetical protein